MIAASEGEGVSLAGWGATLSSDTTPVESEAWSQEAPPGCVPGISVFVGGHFVGGPRLPGRLRRVCMCAALGVLLPRCHCCTRLSRSFPRGRDTLCCFLPPPSLGRPRRRSEAGGAKDCGVARCPRCRCRQLRAQALGAHPVQEDRAPLSGLRLSQHCCTCQPPGPGAPKGAKGIDWELEDSVFCRGSG